MNKCFMLGARILNVEEDKTQKPSARKNKEGPCGVELEALVWAQDHK